MIALNTMDSKTYFLFKDKFIFSYSYAQTDKVTGQ